MATKLIFHSEKYSIEMTEDFQFALSDDTSENVLYDSFDELVEDNPVCEEAREFFF